MPPVYIVGNCNHSPMSRGQQAYTQLRALLCFDPGLQRSGLIASPIGGDVSMGDGLVRGGGIAFLVSSGSFLGPVAPLSTGT